MGVQLLQIGFRILVGALLLVLLSRPRLTCIAYSFHLERAFPLKHINLSHHIVRDKVRHGRLLHGAIDFPISGDGGYHTGLYYSKVSIGTPPKDFYVMIDTGSENMWVSCSSCKSCPTTSPLEEISLNFYNHSKSSTSSLVPCEDDRCRLGFPDSSNCSTDRQLCVYSINYYDKSATSGFFVSDLLHYRTRAQSSRTSYHSSAPFLIGCSTDQTGRLADSVQIVNGIFGFGQHGLSVISQLNSQGNSLKAFAHCLRGDAEGGGDMVLGEIKEPNMVFSPLIRNQRLYYLNMHSISVNDKVLPLDQAMFSKSPNQGALVDTGTTFAYLPDEVYTHLIRAINDYVGEATLQHDQCYLLNSSVSNIFPSVSLIFEDEAVLTMSPEDYLISSISPEGDGMWCMGFIPSVYTILGDLVLKDKIVVYDLVNQRIGWKSSNCSKALNVSTNMHSDSRVLVPLEVTLIASIACFLFLLV